MISWLGQDTSFPLVDKALKDPNGLLAAGGDLSPERLLAAYRRGIFPWYSDGEPILWWSPDPRMVLFPDAFKVSRSLGKTLRNRSYEIRFDGDFDAVMAACSAPRSAQPGTWITDEMRAAYNRLHRMGFAHSVETWMDGSLAGGLYGVAIGRMFYGESMFSRRSDGSKLALAALVRKLQAEGFGMIDCQMHTEHLESLGAYAIARSEFLRRLEELIHLPGPAGSWSPESFKNQPCHS